VSSELVGKIDTTNWINQANIVTPDFKKNKIGDTMSSPSNLRKIKRSQTTKIPDINPFDSNS
jgi:hypothetical protein